MRLLRTCRSSPRASQHTQNRHSSGRFPDPTLSPSLIKGIVYDVLQNYDTDFMVLRNPNKPTVRQPMSGRQTIPALRESNVVICRSSGQVNLVLSCAVPGPFARQYGISVERSTSVRGPIRIETGDRESFRRSQPVLPNRAILQSHLLCFPVNP